MKENLKNRLINLTAKIAKVNFETVKITDSDSSLSSDSDFAVGTEVFEEKADGTRVSAQNGSYKLEDKRTVEVADGKITVINTEAEMEDAPAESAPVETEQVETAIDQNMDDVVSAVEELVTIVTEQATELKSMKAELSALKAKAPAAPTKTAFTNQPQKENISELADKLAALKKRK